MTLADRVKLRREELGLSQEQLALKMGYSSRTSINKIENGRPCSQKIIARLADALCVSIPYLMGWEEEQKKNDIAVDIAVRLRSDDEFLSIVCLLNEFDEEKLQKAKQIIQLL